MLRRHFSEEGSLTLLFPKPGKKPGKSLENVEKSNERSLIKIFCVKKQL